MAICTFNKDISIEKYSTSPFKVEYSITRHMINDIELFMPLSVEKLEEFDEKWGSAPVFWYDVSCFAVDIDTGPRGVYVENLGEDIQAVSQSCLMHHRGDGSLGLYFRKGLEFLFPMVMKLNEVVVVITGVGHTVYQFEKDGSPVIEYDDDEFYDWDDGWEIGEINFAEEKGK